MKADWTTYDPVITRALAEFGRSGVPLYVIYPADVKREPIVLPEIINAGIVLRSLKDLN
jgi:thiol:disulfide interchange protein DsbD